MTEAKLLVTTGNLLLPGAPCLGPQTIRLTDLSFPPHTHAMLLATFKMHHFQPLRTSNVTTPAAVSSFHLNYGFPIGLSSLAFLHLFSIQ